MTHRTRISTRRLGAFAAVAALALTACGGDDDAGDAPETSVAAAADTAPDTAPASSSAGTTSGPGPDTTAPAAPASSEPPGSAPGTAPEGSVPQFTGAADSEFCGIAGELDAVSSEDPANPFDREFYRETLGRFAELYPDLVASAPPEIAADVAIEAASFEEMDAVFAAVDYNFLDVDLGLLPDSPELDAAKARVDAYLDQVCGIERDADDDDRPTEGTMRDLLADQFVSQGASAEQAECMVDYLATSEAGGTDFDLGIGVMAACGFTQPLIAEGFTEEEAQCAVDYLSTADTSGSEVEIGIALVAACGMTQPLIDQGFTEPEAECVVDYLATADDIDTSDTTQLGLDVIRACEITRFFTERGFSEADAQCMVDELAAMDDVSDAEAVVAELVELCVAG